MKKKKDEVQEDFVAELKSCFDDWEYMKLNGCDDPNWEDGANMNLVRNHIYYYKQKILEKFGKDNLPEIYFKEDPPEVEEEYMAKAELIKKLAPIRLAEYKTDENFKRLQMALDVLDEKTIEKLFIDTIVGYASGLELVISEGDFVTMRNHALGKGYFDSFERCVEELKNISFDLIDGPKQQRKPEQVTLF